MKFPTYIAVVEASCGTLTRHEAPGPIRAQVECRKLARARGLDVDKQYLSVLVFAKDGGDVRAPFVQDGRRWDLDNTCPSWDE